MAAAVVEVAATVGIAAATDAKSRSHLKSNIATVGALLRTDGRFTYQSSDKDIHWRFTKRTPAARTAKTGRPSIFRQQNFRPRKYGSVLLANAYAASRAQKRTSPKFGRCRSEEWSQ